MSKCLTSPWKDQVSGLLAVLHSGELVRERESHAPPYEERHQPGRRGMTSENRAASMEEEAFAEISTMTTESAAPPAKPTFAGLDAGSARVS